MTRIATKRGATSRKTINTRQMLANAGAAADFLKALANGQRLAILCSLLDGPQSVGQINERIQLSQSALSQHLAVLRENGLVSTEKSAQTVFYAITDDKTRQLLQLLHDCFCHA